MTSSPLTLAVDRAAATPTRRGQRNRSNVPLQTLILRLDGITAGDHLTWCRDPDPPAFDYGLRSISIDADPLGDTISAVRVGPTGPAAARRGHHRGTAPHRRRAGDRVPAR
jgi:hypothetical protein